MAIQDTITEGRAREIAEAHARALESTLRPTGTLPTYDVHIISVQARRHGWVFRHNAHECALLHRSQYVPDDAPLYVRNNGHKFFLPASNSVEDGIARLERAFEGKAIDPALFVPANKFDGKAAHNAAALGYPAVEPILRDLLLWMRDMNWPVAGTVSQFLVTVGAPLAPHIRSILNGADEVLKYSIIGVLIGRNAELFALFKSDLERIATAPTEAEHREKVDEKAHEALADPPER